MENKYLLHIINKIVGMVSPLRDLVYTYEYRKINISNMNGSHNYSRRRDMTVYHVFNTFNVGDHL